MKTFAGDPVPYSDFTKQRLYSVNFDFRDLNRSNFVNTEIELGSMTKTNLNYSNFEHSSFSMISAPEADFSHSSFYDVKFRATSLKKADFSYTSLINVTFFHCSLMEANFTGAVFSNVSFPFSDLSGAKGFSDPSDFIAKLEHTPDGVIVYKTFNQFYDSPSYWEIAPGKILKEECDTNRTVLCSYGINVGTLDWVNKNTSGPIWRCLIRWEWLPGVVVPFNTNGLFRCNRLEIIGPNATPSLAL